MNFKEDLRQHYKIVLTKEQEDLFEIYYNEMIEYNKHTNLTRITNKEEAYYKHFYDSLTLLPFIKEDNISLCDMGSGAGFPSLPLKIINNRINVTIIDSSMKRINFLKLLVDKLKLTNVVLVHSRIEDYATNNQNKFDYVTARALGHATLISEMAIPMLRKDGKFLMMKGSQGFDETKQAETALKTLKSEVSYMQQLSLPNDFGIRTLIEITKKEYVKGYPRKYQEMIKKPL